MASHNPNRVRAARPPSCGVVESWPPPFTPSTFPQPPQPRRRRVTTSRQDLTRMLVIAILIVIALFRARVPGRLSQIAGPPTRPPRACGLGGVGCPTHPGTRCKDQGPRPPGTPFVFVFLVIVVDLRHLSRRFSWRAPRGCLLSPHFSPVFVARVPRCRAQWGFRPEGRGGVLDGTSSTPRGENIAGWGALAATAGDW